MKAIYMTPSTEVIKTEACALMAAQISGPGGMTDGGQAGDNIDPQ